MFAIITNLLTSRKKLMINLKNSHLEARAQNQTRRQKPILPPQIYQIMISYACVLDPKRDTAISHTFLTSFNVQILYSSLFINNLTFDKLLN